MPYREDIARYFNAAATMGLTFNQADAIRRDAERLNTISERECNGDLVRVDGDTWNDHKGRPLIADAVYNVSNINGPGPLHYHRARDMETPARARIEAIAASIGATVEFQGDPRGLPVRIIKDGVTIAPPCRY